MNLIKKIFYRATTPSQNRLNIFKTFYINFKTQSFKVAVKFPIIVYGKCTLLHFKKGSIKSYADNCGYERQAYHEYYGMLMCLHYQKVYTMTLSCPLFEISKRDIFHKMLLFIHHNWSYFKIKYH